MVDKRRKKQVKSAPALDVHFPFDFDKALEALVYLASLKIEAFDKYKACKLLFLADKLHLVQHGRPITGDRYFAMQHWPAPTTMLDLLSVLMDGENAASKEKPNEKRVVDAVQVAALASALKLDRSFENPRLSAPQPLERECLSLSDVEALEATVKRFGAKSFGELRALTHGMVEYQNAWKKRGGRFSVPMNFADFFEEDSDALSGARAEMIEDYKLRRAFPVK